MSNSEDDQGNPATGAPSGEHNAMADEQSDTDSLRHAAHSLDNVAEKVEQIPVGTVMRSLLQKRVKVLKEKQLKRKREAEEDEEEVARLVEELDAEEEAKDGIRRVREKIRNNTWEVGPHTRTNAEQQSCTLPLLDELEALKICETHRLKDEYEIRSPKTGKLLKVDLALIAKDPKSHCDILIECKIKNFTHARGQCSYYGEWGERKEAACKVYAYFPDRPDEDVITGFQIDGTGVLWPGEAHRINL